VGPIPEGLVKTLTSSIEERMVGMNTLLNAKINSFTKIAQIYDLSDEELLTWFNQKVWTQTSWDYGIAHNPIVTFEPMTDPEDSTFVLFGDSNDYYKCGTLQSAIRQAIWLEIKDRLKKEYKAYSF
jgi:hypothetical protein